MVLTIRIHLALLTVKGPKRRVTLSISISKGWCLRQLDVCRTRFFMVTLKQSPSYEHQGFPNYVCKLDKTLLWFEIVSQGVVFQVSEKLQKLGFTPSRANISLFFYNIREVLLFCC